MSRKTELQTTRDRLRVLNVAARQALDKLRTVRLEMNTPASVNKYAPTFRRQQVAEAESAARAAVRAAATEAKTLTAAPLAELRALEDEATRRRTTRKLLLTERLLPAARFTPAVVPKVYAVNADAPSPLLRDVVEVAKLNAAETHNALLAELVEEQKRARIGAELRAAPPAELARLAGDASARGDAALLFMVRQELHARPLPATDLERAQRNPAVVAIGRAVESLPLPAEMVEELRLLDDLADASVELGSIGHEVATGEPSATAKSARVSEVGADAFLAGQRADREAAELARRAGRAPAQPDNPPAPLPVETPAGTIAAGR